MLDLDLELYAVKLEMKEAFEANDSKRCNELAIRYVNLMENKMKVSVYAQTLATILAVLSVIAYTVIAVIIGSVFWVYMGARHGTR